MSYVVDTNIFNMLVDGTVNIDDLPLDGTFVISHIQVDELNNTKDSERRAQLFLKFAEVRPELVPTESSVWGVSRWDQGSWSDGVLFSLLKQDLDILNKSKPNNTQDVLIAEIAIVRGFTLLTSDRQLAEVVEKHGGKVVLFRGA